MQQLNSTGHHFYWNQMQIVLENIGYPIESCEKIRSIHMENIGKESILWCSILIFGGCLDVHSRFCKSLHNIFFLYLFYYYYYY